MLNNLEVAHLRWVPNIFPQMQAFILGMTIILKSADVLFFGGASADFKDLLNCASNKTNKQFTEVKAK